MQGASSHLSHLSSCRQSNSAQQFPSWCALQLQSGAQVWRRVAAAAAAAASFSIGLDISWLGFGTI
jgi:hypothetical protein